MRPTYLLLMLTLGAAGCITGKDTPAPDGPPPSDGPAAEGAPAEGGTGGTFNIKGTLQVLPLGDCQAADADKDCKGPVYWGIFDQPVSALGSAVPLFAATISDGKDGAAYAAQGIPRRPKLYLSAFMDDNGNMKPLSPLPDSGDLVYYDLKEFVAQEGETVKRDIPLLIRLP